MKKFLLTFAASSMAMTVMAQGQADATTSIPAAETTAVEYDLTLSISNPKPNADGEISADRSLGSFFFVCEEKGLVVASGTDDNVTIKSDEGDFVASARLRKANGLNSNYSYFSAAFLKEPAYNGVYTITVDRGAFGTEEWAEDPTTGRSNDVIELTFTLVDGADRTLYSLEPTNVDPKEGSYTSCSDISKVTLTYAPGVEMVKGASAILAGVDNTYLATATFKSVGNGGYAVTFDPAPTDNGKYLFTVAQGAFGDSDFIAGNGGKGSGPISYTYLIEEKSGVEEMVSSKEAGAIYDLRGMRISTSAEALPAGVYVIDGKKVVVK